MPSLFRIFFSVELLANYYSSTYFAELCNFCSSFSSVLCLHFSTVVCVWIVARRQKVETHSTYFTDSRGGGSKFTTNLFLGNGKYKRDDKKNKNAEHSFNFACLGNGHIYMPSFDDWWFSDSIESCYFPPALIDVYKMPLNRLFMLRRIHMSLILSYFSHPPHLRHWPTSIVQRECNHVMQSHHTKDRWTLNVIHRTSKHRTKNKLLESMIRAQWRASFTSFSIVMSPIPTPLAHISISLKRK